MNPKVYIETSIPSFYFETRTSSEAIARRNWTRQWWSNMKEEYEAYCSEAVLRELRLAPKLKQEHCLILLQDVPLLPFTLEIATIAEIYIARKVMPQNAGGDALHLALASFYGCDFLLTWNCKHIANANKFEHIRRVNESLHLPVPALVTPLELLGEEYE
jgi:hypothetical protein